MPSPKFHRTNTKKLRSGFTLIELLVVIAIISILASILFPVFAKARKAANRTHDVSNLKQLSMAVQLYAQDNDERVPYYSNMPSGPGPTGAKQWPILLFPYFKSIKLLISPVLPEIAGLPRSQTNIYDYFLLRFPSYGYNLRFLSETPPYSGTNLGAHLSVFQQPTKTLSFVTTAMSQLDSMSIPLEPYRPAGGYAYATPPNEWSGTTPLAGTSYGYAWPTHDGFFVAAFMDGHVKAVSVAQLSDHSAENNIWNIDKTQQVGCERTTSRPAWCS